ncbi:MAG: YlbF family regulator [Gemmatimonadales bacterium]
MIQEKARDLGRMIGQSEEYRTLRQAETEMREDKDTVAGLESIQTLATQVDQAMASGQQPDQEIMEKYQEAIQKLEASPSGQAYVVARANFDKLMAKVNQQITEGIDSGATSKIITL